MLYPKKTRKILWLKICDNSICKPLEMILNRYLLTGVFPFEWKWDSIVHICQKERQPKKNNDRQVHSSWLSLLSITHEICKPIDDELEVSS